MSAFLPYFTTVNASFLLSFSCQLYEMTSSPKLIYIYIYIDALKICLVAAEVGKELGINTASSRRQRERHTERERERETHRE